MEEQVELKLFTVADLKEYFIHNRPVELLSERVINHTRAYATIMNPYVTDDMGVVSAIFVNGEVAAYTYVFPDQCLVNGEQRTIYWNTVLYVDSRYEGRGYGAIVIGQMVEQYGEDYFDLDAVPASVENLKFAGLQVDYVDQYILEQKHIKKGNIKGIILSVLESIKHYFRYKHSAYVRAKKSHQYSLRYVYNIDDATYSFILQHSRKDLFVRSQAMLNWILSYPLMQEVPLVERTQHSCFFGENIVRFRYYAVQVRVGGKLVGFYILRNTSKSLYLNNIYFEDAYRETIYLSIVEHIITLKNETFHTADKDLVEYVNTYQYYLRNKVMHKSFAYPANFEYDFKWKIQAGDGDNIV